MATDSITPTLPSDTKIAVSNVTNKGFTITWKAATDNETPTSKLRYRIVWHEGTANIRNAVPAYIEVIGKTNYTFTDLKPGTEYSVSIVLYDEAKNISRYPAITQKTATAAASSTTRLTRPTTTTATTRPRTTTSTTKTTTTTATTEAAQKAADEKRRKEINDYLKDLSFSDDAIQNAIDDENRKNRIEGDYFIKYEKITRPTASTELLMSCDAHSIFPGMFLVVDNNLGTLKPTSSGLSRGKVKIVIDFGSITLSKGNSRIVTADENGNLMSNINKAINEMVEDFRASGKSLTANFIDQKAEGRSQDELKIDASCSASFAGIQASASFEKSQSSFAMQFMNTFIQVFYTVTAEINKKDYSSLFGDDVTVNDIKKSFGNKPIIFVKSVKYGRQICLLEELSGSNESMIQKCDVSGYGLTFKQGFSKSGSRVDYKNELFVRGGGLPAASEILKNTDVSQKEGELDIDFCKRRIDKVREATNELKKNHTNTRLDGTVENDVYGVPLSYSAERLEGINPKSAVFWGKGDYYVKRLIPNTGLSVNVFNCLPSNNIVASGWFTLFDEDGKELPTIYDVQFDVNNKGTKIKHTAVGTLSNIDAAVKKLVNGGNNRGNGRTFTKSFMSPPFNLPKNVYRVWLNIRHRDDSKKKFHYTYTLPCGNIMAGWLRPGKTGGDAVDWYFGGYVKENNDTWFNGGKK